MKDISIILILFIVLLLPQASKCQNNMMEIDWKKLSEYESMIQIDLKLASTAVHFSLKNSSVEDLSYYVKGCKKSSGAVVTIPVEHTIIGFKQNRNLIWTFYFAQIYSTDGRYTDSVYTGYSKTEFGEQTEQYLFKVKKVRLYPENNIFTESISFSSGITLIVEDKLFVREVIFPSGASLLVEKYYYENCDTR